MMRMNTTRYLLATVQLLVILAFPLASQAQTGEPKLTFTQVGLHFICTADGTPDMYSWRLPVRDPDALNDPAKRYDYFIPVLQPAELEANAVGAGAIVSGGRTALRVDPDPLAQRPQILHNSPPGFTGTVRLTNTQAVNWRTPSGERQTTVEGQIKERCYSNFPPLSDPSTPGLYNTTGLLGSIQPGNVNYGRYFRNHPGYDSANWNYSLDPDTPLAPHVRRIQARLHLEIFHPFQPRSNALKYTLVFSKEDLAKILVNGQPVFSRQNNTAFQLDYLHFLFGSPSREGGLLSARRTSANRHRDDSGLGSPILMTLTSKFFSASSSENLNFSSTGPVTAKVYEGHVERDTTLVPIQTITFQLPQGRGPLPELVVASSYTTDYLVNDGTPNGSLYQHPAVEAARWWSMESVGLGRPYPWVPGEIKGRLAFQMASGLGLNAVDPRTNSQRVPGARALFYGFDPDYYPDVKRVSLAEQAADPLKVISYLAPDYNVPIHYGSDVLRVLNLKGDRTPRTTTVPSDFEPEPDYASDEVFMAPGFAMEQPHVLKHPVSVLNVDGPRTATFAVQVDNTTGPNTPPSYQWRRNGVDLPGATQSTLNVQIDAPEDAGSYDVVVTNAKASVASDPAEIQFVDPLIFTQPYKARSKVGGKATFSVTAGGTGLQYQWRRDSLHIAGATSSTLVIDKVKLTDEGQYDVVITGTQGTVVSAAAPLEIIRPLAILQQPVGARLRAGGMAILTVRAVGDNPLSYQWRKNGQPLEGETMERLQVYWSTDPSVAGSYDVLISDSSESMASVRVAITAVDGLPLIIDHPASAQVAAGAAAEFSVLAEGEDLTYQWRKNGVNIARATSAAYAIAGAKEADEGRYECIVSNKAGNVLSNAARLAVSQSLEFLVSPSDASVLSGGAALFSGKASGDESAVAYQWLFNGKPLVGAVAASLHIPTVTPERAGNYTLTASRGSEKISATVVLTVPEYSTLVYKVTGTGQSMQDGITTRVALSGYLVADRLMGSAAWLWTVKNGKYNSFEIQRWRNFRSDSTGPVKGAQAVFSDSEDEAERIQVWLQGTDAMVPLKGGEPTRAPKSLSGHARQLTLPTGDSRRVVVEALTLSATLDVSSSAHARLNQEGLDNTLERLSLDLVDKGYLEIQAPEQ